MLPVSECQWRYLMVPKSRPGPSQVEPIINTHESRAGPRASVRTQTSSAGKALARRMRLSTCAWWRTFGRDNGALFSRHRQRTLSICLINPRFEPSFWGFEYALPHYPGDRRSTMISGSLPALEGLSAGHEVYLLDENVENIDWDSVRRRGRRSMTL